MSLNRLSPRSSRKGMTRQRHTKKRETGQSRHLHLWAAIRNTRDELSEWQRKIDQVDGLFNQFIVPREHKLTHEVCNITEQLIHHFSSDRLDAADRSLLGLWISENLQSLQGHPFAPVQRTQVVTQEWKLLISKEGAIENQLSKLAKNMHDMPTTDTPCASVEHEGIAGEIYQNKNRESGNDQTEQKDSNTSQTDADEDVQSKAKADRKGKRQSVEEKISALDEKLSVDRLFRQLARTLHPDREQDEERRTEKHVLMSQCLEARKKKDINTLLNLYCEHVGDLPDDIGENSHAELIAALETQLKQLQAHLRQLRFSDPLHTMIVERYASPDVNICEQRIESHSASLDSEISAMQRLGRQLKFHDGLLDSLDERRAVEQDRLAIDELTGKHPDSY